MQTDRWFFRVFQSAPDLVTALLPGASAARDQAATPGTEAEADRLYRFSAPELKATSHRLDGVLWPRRQERGTREMPVVILEVQMHNDPDFRHRLAAETFRFLQQQPRVEHLAVVVITSHARLRLGPERVPQQLRGFLDQAIWFDLEALSQQGPMDPLVDLLTLPVRREAELPERCQAILDRHPELLELIVPILLERFAGLSLEEIMVIIGTPIDELRHTRAAQQLISEGRMEGRAEGEVAVTLRLLARRCGPLSPAITTTIQSLPLPALEALAEALLDFRDGEDLKQWLSEHAS